MSLGIYNSKLTGGSTSLPTRNLAISREYEIRERIPVATVNWLTSIFSTGGYFYLDPRTLQVLFCQCVLNDPDKLGYFLKRKVPNRTPPKPEFRASCSWVLFGRGTFELAWIWFIQTMKSSRHLESTKVLDCGSQPLHSGSQRLDSGFQPFGFRIPNFWIPDSIPQWILDSKPLWIPDSSPLDSNCKNLPDSGFRILLRARHLNTTSRIEWNRLTLAN